MHNRRYPLVVALLLVALTVRIASSQVPEALVVAPVEPAGKDYVIGPGDTLGVFVWQNPDLSMAVPVRPDGKISTPLIDDMPAVGKTSAQLASDIQTALGEYVRNPKVSVIVTNPMGALGQVKVIGQVKSPHGIPYRKGLRVLDVVLEAGGITNFAAPNRSKLLRTENGRQETIRVRLGDLLEDGEMQQNIELLPGDVLVIPASRF